MLRRASSSLLPLAIHTVGSPRAFHSAISTVLSTEKCSFCRSSVVLFQRFSTKPTSDENLVEALEYEINCADQPTEKCIPGGFPFEIQDNPGERTILLTREYQDEIIKEEVDVSYFDDEEDDNKRKEINDNDSIPLVVSITKGSGTRLEFYISTSLYHIQIDRLSIKLPENSEDRLGYDGPDFKDFDINLQKAFHKYIVNRGLRPSTTYFFINYLSNKDNKEYWHWLNKVKKFFKGLCYIQPGLQHRRGLVEEKNEKTHRTRVINTWDPRVFFSFFFYRTAAIFTLF